MKTILTTALAFTITAFAGTKVFSQDNATSTDLSQNTQSVQEIQTTQNTQTMQHINSKTIVLVHGAFVTKDTWSEWKTFFENKGYTVIVPSWPFKDTTAEVLRSRQPDSAIATLTLNTLLAHYTEIINKLPEKPILIGHSFGGLLTQILVSRGLGEAGVAIHSVPPQGVFTLKPSFYKATAGPLGFFTSRKKTFLMSFKQWQYAFTNGQPYEEQKRTYDLYVVPESKQIAWDGLSKNAKVDFKKPHAPLLFISGSTDNIMPASLNYSNFKRYSDKNSITEYKEYEGHNHNVLGLPTWKEEANYIYDWISQLSGSALTYQSK